jgi:hypothetical protein
MGIKTGHHSLHGRYFLDNGGSLKAIWGSWDVLRFVGSSLPGLSIYSVLIGTYWDRYPYIGTLQQKNVVLYRVSHSKEEKVILLW